MIVYTAEDFEQANLARRGESGVARRTEPRLTRQWRAYGEGHGWFSDEEMAADGWEPVVESRVTDHTLRRVEERAERKRQKLIAHIESVEAAVRDRNRTIEELYVAKKEASRRESAAHDRVVALLDTKKTHERAIAELRHDLKVALAEVADLGDENDRLERILQSPLSLKDLEAAWEAAEVPTDDNPIRDGDVVIVRHGGGFTVEPADRILSGQTHGRERILSRAPKREPWADLAGALVAAGVAFGDEYPDLLARRLYENGVRMAGGNDDE